MSGIMKAAETGEPIPLPERILATTEEAGVAVKMYEIAKALDFDHELVELPSNDDHVGDNPAWWDLKARVRFKNGDVYGAISDVMRAITLRPNSEGSHVCLGHFFREIKHFDLAATAYECAIRLNDQAWAGLVGLSRVQAHQERWKEAKNTLEIARKRGAPNELLEEVFLSEKRA
jgi:tetratricopeptide (TPR) repeat protein